MVTLDRISTICEVGVVGVFGVFAQLIAVELVQDGVVRALVDFNTTTTVILVPELHGSAIRLVVRCRTQEVRFDVAIVVDFAVLYNKTYDQAIQATDSRDNRATELLVVSRVILG